MNNLKEKTISGIIWSFADNSLTQIITFVVGIILARLLSPAEFGLVGMIGIFIAVGQAFVDSGFNQALIRKQDCTSTDYSTVFYFNLAVSIIFYIILFFSAGYISDFFKEPKLIDILRIVSLSILFNAFGLVQQTQLTKEIKIKVQTKISVTANISSGIISVLMAYNGFGVWSLVFRNLIHSFITNLSLWYFNKWKPALTFSFNSFKEMYAFGSKLFLSGLLNRIFENIYYFAIGKYFSAEQLGYYTRSDTFARLPSTNINGVVQRISYPVLVKLQNDDEALKKALKKLIKSTMFITMFFMVLMASSAESLIITLIGEKWMQSVLYLQLLCFSLILFPLQSLNLNMLNVKGRSDLFLRLEIIKKLLIVPVVLIGIIFGIKIMLFAMIINSIISYYLNSYYNKMLINYSITEQLKDILPSIIVVSISGTLVFTLGQILSFNYLILLIIQSISGLILVILLSEFLKLEPYLEIKNIITDKIWIIKERI
uniref:Lipopolysaccharide biosynthesis protein n=1 Tax=Ignavibacterium album TaxID=591197 RepID=A0A7V2ZIE4_9BACT